MVSDLATRIAFGRAIILRRTRIGSNWETCVQEATIDDDLISKLCLIHPEWYNPQIKISGQYDPRGPRNFTTQPSGFQECQSNQVWGYMCMLEKESIVADHLYPYAAGGATDSRNLVWLCGWHNRVKSSDIHLVDWDGIDLTWIDDLLTRIAKRRHMLTLMDEL